MRLLLMISETLILVSATFLLMPEPALALLSGEVAESRLTGFETRLFRRDFGGTAVAQRLSRLEKAVFGQMLEGSEEDRLDKLDSAFASLDAEKKISKSQSKSTSQSHSQTEAKGKPGITFRQAYNAAIKDLKLRRYHAAADGFLEAIRLNPYDPASYAYLGETLLVLKDRGGATESFKACFEVAPSSTYGRYAKGKLMALSAQSAYLKASPQDSPRVVAKTIEQINKQSKDLGRRYNTEFQNWSKWQAALYGMQSARIARTANGRLRQVYGDDVATDNGWRQDAEFSNQASIRNVRNQSAGMTRMVREQNNARLKALYVAESAANLKDQLLKAPRPGDARLRALGTNLYVRYFGDESSSEKSMPVPDDPPIELRATALKLKE